MDMYFPRYLIASTMTTYFAVVMKYLLKYMPMYLILSCAKGATYRPQLLTSPGLGEKISKLTCLSKIFSLTNNIYGG